MAQPNKEKWLHISQGFQENSDFPNCIGAVDGKHIRIKPLHSGSLYFNYKSYFSIQLLAICDANYCFIYVNIGDFGKITILLFTIHCLIENYELVLLTFQTQHFCLGRAT
jgi:hypothetical protein